MIIIDDVVDKPTQELIEQMVFTGYNPRWVYANAHPYPKRIPQITASARTLISPPSFYFDIVKADGQGKLVDPSYQPFLSPISHLNVKKIFKTRCALFQPVRTIVRFYNPAHLDALPEHYNTDKFKVAVYYVSDSEGPTIFYKETYQSAKDKGLSDEDITNCNMDIEAKVDPKKGRIVIFDHDQYHSTGLPKDHNRCIINYNFYV